MIGGKKYLSINTDAGINEKTKKGYYAFWIKSDEQTIKRSGEFKNIPIDSNEAEMMAIVNALDCAMNNRDIYSCDIVIINTDSKNAIHSFTNQLHNVKPKYHHVREEYKRMVSSLKQYVELRHVKGHSQGRTAKEWVNNWCDSELKKLLRNKVKT